MKKENEVKNPLTGLDYPDPDVIRVEDTYYMVSTTMHFMPGCEILRSYDLVNWEHVSFVYDRLDSTKRQCLKEGKDIYGKGMWAASLRYHKGRFYICFVANDTGKTYLYIADRITGPWEKHEIDGFYHDCSLFFDEDDKAYLVYGNTQIRLQQLKEDLSGPKEGGISRVIISDEGNPNLGYEGTHFYMISGRYYAFLIHSLRTHWKRVEACFVSDSLEGKFRGGDLFEEDMGYCNQGVAQGGIVDTPDGRWYSVLFQDRGAVGRIPVLVPVVFNEGYPVFGEAGKLPKCFSVASTRPQHVYIPLVDSDDFKVPEENIGKFPEGHAEETAEYAERYRQQYGCFGFKSVWQFNHEPELSLVEHRRKEGQFLIRTGEICTDVTRAKNTLTQRMCYPECAGEVTLDFSGLKDGDYAGLCAFQGCYGFVGVTKKNGKSYVVMVSKEAEDADMNVFAEGSMGEREWEAVPILGERIRLRVEADFTLMKDEAKFFYAEEEGAACKEIGITHKLYFKLDHFTGCRFALFMYSTKEYGGCAGFSNFVYQRN